MVSGVMAGTLMHGRSIWLAVLVWPFSGD